MDITLLELHVDDATADASFSAALPFSGSSDESTADDADDTDDTDDTDDAGRGVPTKALAALGLVTVLVVVAAVLKRRGGEDPDVDIETPDDSDRPVSVTVDDE